MKRMETGQLQVDLIGSIILVRLRGTVGSELLEECQARVVAVAGEAPITGVLYDVLAVDAGDRTRPAAAAA
jgi:hypothetical protein